MEQAKKGKKKRHSKKAAVVTFAPATKAATCKTETAAKAKASDTTEQCWFCQSTPAAVKVTMSTSSTTNSNNKKRRNETHPLCLLHYYTTRAVRVNDPKNIRVLDQKEVENQLKNGGIQDLFAEAYTELQQELAQESARSFRVHQKDPLAILQDFAARGKKKAKRVATTVASAAKKPSHDDDEGGFLRNIPLPERLRQHQERQLQLQQEQTARMDKAAAAPQQPQVNPYKRRKGTQKSIWNLAMQKTESTDGEKAPSLPAITMDDNVTCSCGSTKVTNTGNITGRHNDMRKGETWGNKDRSDALVTRYQCNACGKVWNEEE